MEFINEINTVGVNVASISGVFKLLFLIIVFGYIIYTLLLTVRIRILNDTVKSPSSGIMSLVSYIHLCAVLVGGLLSVILILVS